MSKMDRLQRRSGRSCQDCPVQTCSLAFLKSIGEVQFITSAVAPAAVIVEMDQPAFVCPSVWLAVNISSNVIKIGSEQRRDHYILVQLLDSGGTFCFDLQSKGL